MSDRLCINISCDDRVEIYQLMSLEHDFLSIAKEVVELFVVNSENSAIETMKLLEKLGVPKRIKLESMQFPPNVKKVLDSVPGGYGISERLNGIDGTPEQVLATLNKIVELPEG